MYRAIVLGLISALCTSHVGYSMNLQDTETQVLLEDHASPSNSSKSKHFSPTATCCLLFGTAFLTSAGIIHLIVQHKCAGMDLYNSSLNCTGNGNVIISSTGGFGYLANSNTNSSENAHACQCSDLVLGQDVLGVGGAISIASSALACLCKTLHVAYKRCAGHHNIPTGSSLIN